MTLQLPHWLGGLLLAALLCQPALADTTITVDGDPADWPADGFTFEDQEGDLPPPWADIIDVQITDDNASGSDGFLYVGIEFASHFRDPLGSNDVDIYLYLDIDGDGIIGGPDDRIIELTEGVITDGDGNVVGSIAAMAYDGTFMEAAIPYSVLGLTNGADTFGVSFAATGKPDGTIDQTPEAGEGDGGFIIYDGTGPQPLAVQLAGFSVRSQRHGNLVSFATGAERGNLGFHIYRLDERARPIRITRNPLPGLGHAALGRTYRHLDPEGLPGDRYLIEDLEISGKRSLHGPVAACIASKVIPEMRSAKLRLASRKKLSNKNRAPRAKDLSKASQKLAVRNAGLVRLPVPQGRLPALTRSGTRVPSLLRGHELIFVGIPQVDRWADHEVILTSRGRAKPMLTRRAGGCLTGASTSALHKLEGAENHTYLIQSVGPDPFLWSLFFPGLPATLAVDVPAPTRDPASLRLDLVGLTANHAAIVSVNGIQLGELEWMGSGAVEHELQLPGGLLQPGSNQIQIRVADGIAWDLLFVEGLQITYQRELLIEDGPLAFEAQAGTCLALRGPGEQAPILIDVSAPDAPVQLIGLQIKPDGLGGHIQYFQDAGVRGQRSYIAWVPGTPLPEPEFMGMLSRRKLDSPALRADYLIISHPDFVPAARRLVEFHRSQGRTPMVITTAEAYDAFSNGRRSPEAIRKLIDTALNRWRLSPEYVLLMGAASVDPNGYLPDSGPDYLPSPFRVTSQHSYEAASDGWYAAGPDGLTPRVAIGRLAVRNPAEADAVVDKILHAYDQAASGRLGLVADDYDPAGGSTAQFEQDTLALAETCLPNDDNPELFFKSREIDPSAALLQLMESGPDAISYHGHAFLSAWSSSPLLLTSEQAIELTNERTFALFSWTCFDGAHTGPWGDSLAWSLLANPNGGAHLVTAASSLSDPVALAELGQQVICRLRSGQAATVGQALLQAKQALAGLSTAMDDVLASYNLFGDPAMPNPFCR